MESLEDQYGYDKSIFISEIPDHLLCMICTLVLRDPIQILCCGHKACELCFERIKNQSTINNTELRCPVDRELVNLTDVREDVYLRRLVGNMMVHCYLRDQGCEWQGDLRELHNHTEQCPFNLLKQGGDIELLTSTMKQLTNRMVQCEHSLANIYKEIALLKHQLQDQQQTNDEGQSLKQQTNEGVQSLKQQTNEEVQSLKQQMKEEIHSLKQQVSQLAWKNIEVEQRQQQEKQQLQQDMADIRSKNEALERQMTELHQKNLELEEKLQNQQQVSEKSAEFEQRQKHEKQQQQQDIADLRSRNEILEHQVTQISQKNVELEERVHQQQEQQEKLKQEEQINDLKAVSETQQLTINELATEVEKLQKGILSNRNSGSTISLNTQPSASGGQPGANFVAEEPVVVRRKKITVEHHNGDPKYVTISKDTHSVEFTGDYTTVSTRGAVVPPTSKVWYEVKCTGRNKYIGGICVGWCTSDFPTSKTCEWVGEDVNSYSFHPFNGYKYHNRKINDWGKKLTGDTCVVGVALDLVKGEILFSVDGQWTRPMGVAFKDVPTQIKLFPAFSGHDLTVQYNFGDRDFTFGPPDPTFVKLFDVVK